MRQGLDVGDRWRGRVCGGSVAARAAGFPRSSHAATQSIPTSMAMSARLQSRSSAACAATRGSRRPSSSARDPRGAGGAAARAASARARATSASSACDAARSSGAGAAAAVPRRSESASMGCASHSGRGGDSATNSGSSAPAARLATAPHPRRCAASCTCAQERGSGSGSAARTGGVLAPSPPMRPPLPSYAARMGSRVGWGWRER
jgi:hypothetical protein